MDGEGGEDAVDTAWLPDLFPPPPRLRATTNTTAPSPAMPAPMHRGFLFGGTSKGTNSGPSAAARL